MNVYVTGYQRSGNNWLSMLIAEAIGASTDCVLDRKRDEGKEHRVIQRHCLPEMLQTESPIFHIVRDPRDIAVSALHYFPKHFKTISEVLDCMYEGGKTLGIPWHIMVQSWMEAGVPIVRYEDLLEDAEIELWRLFYEEEIETSSEDIARAVMACDFERMKARYPEEGRHFRSGRSGEWVDYFSVEDCVKVENYFGNPLKVMNYND